MSAPIKTLVFIGLATTQLATSPAQARDPAFQRIQDTIFAQAAPAAK